MQTKPLPNTQHARMPPPPYLPEMFRLEDVMDFPVRAADLVGLAKAAFNYIAGAHLDSPGVGRIFRLENRFRFDPL